MNILLLSAYDAPSHRRWRTGLVDQLPGNEWTVLSLPPRYFSWRVRGNSLTWSHDPRLKNHFDLVIATSMTDLSGLRGMLPSLAKIPTIVYFHENQFAYPDNRQESRTVEPAILNLYSAICADRLVFNSDFNQTSFMQGATSLLRKLPDHVPPGIVPGLLAKSMVLPVPLESNCFQQGAIKADRFTLLWNHRWEYDKGPDRLLAICDELIRRNVDFCLNLLGQSFRDTPAPIQKLIDLLNATGRLGRCGFIEDESEYRACLTSSHLVLSTAIHEFQGLSVLEGMAGGCYPVVPDRLSYPEFVAPEYRYADGGEPGYRQETESAVELIQHLAESPPSTPIDLSRFSWSQLRRSYQQLIDAVGNC